MGASAELDARPSTNPLERLRKVIGMDRAIALTVFARFSQIIGSTGTVLLIVRFLSPVEQGYYYTLLSLVALQNIFDLGFSFVILQMAAHESVHLVYRADGQLEGDSVAHAHLASVLKQTVKWYFAAGVVLMMALLSLGTLFFSKYSLGNPRVSWRGAWVFALIAATVLFVMNPFFSFLEGCGQINEVAAMRFVQGVSAIVMPWAALISGHGLYAPGSVNTGFAVVGIVFLWSRRKLLSELLRHESGTNAISWRREIWPFQWRLAVSFTCSYITAQVFTPILFAYRGAAEAGRMGISMSICGYLWSIVIPWISTKATPFGKLIARSEYEELDRVFSKTVRQALIVLSALVLSCFVGIEVLNRVLPRIGSRMLEPNLFGLLLLTSVSTFLVQSQAVYLRAHKEEPLLWQSVVVAVLTVCGIVLTVPRWGQRGAVFTYLVCTGVVSLGFATAILRMHRRVHPKNSALLRGYAE